ncbi:MAG: hypothetical protein AKCLJLPJ_00449 [Fimbriimonadales bacterium]|nr:hypothetical protein [Fimbriimonadales bacterium]
MNSPIADLTYRQYDGPKSLPALRWWVVARHGIRVAMRKKGFWVLASCAMIPSFLLFVFSYIRSTIEANPNIGRNARLIDSLPNFDELYAGVYGSWYWVFFLSLLLGAGVIAADNRANALQVYLSKPITKADYLIGKWMSVFIPVYLVGLAPLLISVLYGMFSIGVSDFFPLYGSLLPKTFILPAIPAIVHSSCLIGVSALTKNPWVAGVSYTAVYVFANSAAFILYQALRHGPARLSEQAAEFIRSLSIQGAISGIGFDLIGAMPRDVAQFRARPTVEWQPLAIMLFLLCVLGLFIAYRRIRAVEVIQG